MRQRLKEDQIRMMRSRTRRRIWRRWNWIRRRSRRERNM